MTEQIGMRIGAILSANRGTVKFLGYGTYQGDQVHPEFGFPNPKLVLDNGDTVWGCECWWGPEEQIRKEIEGHKIEEVRIRETTH